MLCSGSPSASRARQDDVSGDDSTPLLHSRLLDLSHICWQKNVAHELSDHTSASSDHSVCGSPRAHAAGSQLPYGDQAAAVDLMPLERVDPAARGRVAENQRRVLAVHTSTPKSLDVYASPLTSELMFSTVACLVLASKARTSLAFIVKMILVQG